MTRVTHEHLQTKRGGRVTPNADGNDSADVKRAVKTASWFVLATGNSYKREERDEAGRQHGCLARQEGGETRPTDVIPRLKLGQGRSKSGRLVALPGASGGGRRGKSHQSAGDRGKDCGYGDPIRASEASAGRRKRQSVEDVAAKDKRRAIERTETDNRAKVEKARNAQEGEVANEMDQRRPADRGDATRVHDVPNALNWIRRS